MSNIDAVNALITAINFDRFAEIEARHAPDAVFHSFRGPTLHNSVAIADWHREFLRDYADCNYTDLEYIDDGDVVVVRATIEAKAVDWRAFTQRVLEVFRVGEFGISERRMYGMIPDLQLDKAATAAMTNALGFKGGSVEGTRRVAAELMATHDPETVGALFDANAVYIDSVYGVAHGFENIHALVEATPRPLFGRPRLTASYHGEHSSVGEHSIDPGRPRYAEWVRIVDEHVAVIERYWMFREIGIDPFAHRRERHVKPVILPT
ncbi:MAG: nuclear transport factor 2 family protein [Tepidiformaceae bacterium]